ncbi:hypothetical protein GQ457_09G027490 [Hibiscus cannabinus]
MVLEIVFPPSLVHTAASVVVLISMAILGILETRGTHLKYSKFFDASSSISPKVPSRIGMILGYTPPFLVGVASFRLLQNGDFRFLLLKSAITIHFFKRILEIPEEEKNLGPHDRLIHVYHFLKDTTQNQVQNFGEPFFLVIHETETLAEVKVRIQKRLQVPDEEFAKWKFAFLSLARPDYLQDSDVVATRFQRRDVYGAWEQYLGLEHSDNAPKRSYAANQNRHAYEKPVKIYN